MPALATAILQLVGTLAPLAIQEIQAVAAGNKAQHDQVVAAALQAATAFTAAVNGLLSTEKANDEAATKAEDGKFGAP